MFCWQCEQTRNGTGCENGGVCGKKPEVSDLQDLLRYGLEEMSQAALAARELGFQDPAIDRFTVGAVFSTITNVEFDPERLQALIRQTVQYRDLLREKSGSSGTGPETIFQPAADLEGLIQEASKATWRDLDDPVVLSMRETAIYGLKGLCAYADHAAVLGREDEEIFKFVYECLAAGRDKSLGLDYWLNMAMRVGEMNLRTMKLLDEANTGAYGHPQPPAVPLGFKKGKCIVITGHDLRDLKLLLEQTAGRGINIYTHGEMLPAHGYPELKKYPHFHGHFGTAWQNQTRELPEFPGPVIFTTNCIQRPGPESNGHTFTTGLVGWPGIPHITAEAGGLKDFSPVIEKALAMPGYERDQD